MNRSKLHIAIVSVLFGSMLSSCFLDDDSPTTTTVAASPTASSKEAKEGFSSSPGVLTDYATPVKVDSSGKELFAIYMVGSDLEDKNSATNTGKGAGSVDFGELVAGYKKLSSNEQAKVDIIVAFGGSLNWPGMRIANIEQIVKDYEKDQIMGNMEATEYLYEAPKAHMGDKSSLELFLKYIGDSYSNHEYSFLDMWDHGSAFGSFGNDSNYNHDGLSMQETDDALTAAGIKFNTIGYDACLNANFELASVIKKHADYMIASAETEPGHGWDYENVLTSFVRNQDKIVFFKEMIDDFIQNEDHRDDGRTLSAVDLRKYDDLLAAVNGMATEVKNNIDDAKVKDLIVQMHNPFNSDTSVEGYGKSTEGKGRRGRRGRRGSSSALTYDLQSFAEKIQSNTTGELSTSAQKVIDAVKSYVIVAKSDSTKPNANGVSIASMIGGSNLKETQTPSQSYRDLGTYINDTYATSDTVKPVISSTANRGSSNPVLPINMVLRNYHQKDSGTSITVTDANLRKVTTLYGNILSDPDGNEAFLSVAELGTSKTTTLNEYYTPTWNQKWYILKYGEAETANVPLFVTFKKAIKNSKGTIENTVYSAEIEFINQEKDYSDEDDAFDLAKLEIKVDANDKVVSTTVLPFKTLYDSEEDEDGYFVFEKYGKPLGKGDKFRMYSLALDLSTDETFYNQEMEEFVEVTIDPTYTFEDLKFYDEKEQLLKYYYMMIAEDLAGNITKTDIIPVVTVDDAVDTVE